MSSWNLKELRDLIEEKYGKKQLEKARPHIDSVDWKIGIVSYHSYVSEAAFKGLFNNEESETIQAVKLILSSGEEASKFNEARVIAEANLIACAQSMHSVLDIFAHVIFHALKIEEMEEDEITITAINKKLPEGALKTKITRLLGLRGFNYLKDFVNTTKHISLIFSSYNVNLEDLSEQEHGLKLNSFSYQVPNSTKTRKHPEKWSNKFLNELKFISLEYVNIGQEINNVFKQG